MSYPSDEAVRAMAEANESEIILYQSEDGTTRIDVRMLDETVWLSQAQMAELFGKSIKTINEHVRNIFKEGELEEDSVVRKFRITAADGKQYLTMHYNLDVIISVGYRVRSQQGTRFRQWATARLREYLVKGFALDDKRLKENRSTDDYFDELLERVREIRTSEIRLHKKVTEIYRTSIDYDPHSEITKNFFATVQNKLHYAVTGMTAAEVVKARSDAEKPNMGLTTYSGKSIRKKDVTVAKNYLAEEELSTLRLLVEQYLGHAELQARSRNVMRMQDWIERLDEFLKFNRQELLDNAGRVSRKQAKEKAHEEYEKYRERLLQEPSDYEQFVEETKKFLGP